MENQGKSPETIVAEAMGYKMSCPAEECELAAEHFHADADWLLSSLSDLLRWSAEQMPEGFPGTELPYDEDTPPHFYNNAIDDCKATLLRLADEICKK